MEASQRIKPMPLWASLLFFGIPTLIATAAIYYGIPLMDKMGLPLFWNFFLFTGGPLVLMFIASFIAYRMEGNPMDWSAFKDRFRLKPINGKEWWWTVGLLIVYIVGYFLLLPTAKWLASFPAFTPPDYIPPVVDPRVVQAGIPRDFLGMPLKGNWRFLAFYLLILFFNIFGEEFWWRGYILPRQEKQHGAWTWVIHGILWNLFHVFWKWNLIALIPQTLSLSFVAYKTKNSSHGIIVHWINNGLGFVLMLLAVLGVGS